MIDPETAGFGHVVEYPNARIVRLSEEHGEVDASKCDRRPKLGERVHVIPNHICPCINLHDSVMLRDIDGSMQELKIDARGKVQ
jgi:D-serine deaminase-like pyridoxal phosphate-dependent protein